MYVGLFVEPPGIREAKQQDPQPKALHRNHCEQSSTATGEHQTKGHNQMVLSDWRSYAIYMTFIVESRSAFQ